MTTTAMNPAGALFPMQQWQLRLLPAGFSGRLAERYEMEEPEIGQGRFGVVRRCRRKGWGGAQRLLAVKSISKLLIQSGRHANALQLELDALAGLRGHPGIVQLLDVVEEEQTIHIVTELCDQGDLFDYLSSAVRLKESDARIIFRRIAAAVEYCHAHCLLHRDIKPENIFLSTLPPEDQEFIDSDAEDAGDPLRKKRSDSGLPSGIGPSASLASIMSPRLVRGGSALDLSDLAPSPQGSKLPLAKGLMPKLGDFGLAVLLDGGKRVSGRMGSSYYMAPEVVRGDSYGLPADIWSLGVILHIMLSGFLPFCGQTSVQTFAAICTGHLDFTTPLWQRISAPAKDLVQRMLDVNECGRPTASELMAHPWLTGHSLPQPVSFMPSWASQPKEGTVVTASKGGASAGGLDDAEEEVSSELPGHQPLAMEILLQQQQHQRRRQLVQHQEEQRDLLHRQQQQQQQWHQWQMWQQQMQFQQHQQQLVQRQLQQHHQQRMYQQYQQYQQYQVNHHQRLREELGKQLVREQERQQREDEEYTEQAAAAQEAADLEHDGPGQYPGMPDDVRYDDSRSPQGGPRIVLSPKGGLASWGRGRGGEAVPADVQHLTSGQGLPYGSQNRLDDAQASAMPSMRANRAREAGMHEAAAQSELQEQRQEGGEGDRAQLTSGALFPGERGLDHGSESTLAQRVSLESMAARLRGGLGMATGWPMAQPHAGQRDALLGTVGAAQHRSRLAQQETRQRDEEFNEEQVSAFPEASGQLLQDEEDPESSSIGPGTCGLDTPGSEEEPESHEAYEASKAHPHRPSGSPTTSVVPKGNSLRLAQVHHAGASCMLAGEEGNAGGVGTQEPGSEAASPTQGSVDPQAHGPGGSPAKAETGNKTPAPVSFSWLRLGTPPTKPVAARLLTTRKPQDLATSAEGTTGSRLGLTAGAAGLGASGAWPAMHFDLSAVVAARRGIQAGKLPERQQEQLELEDGLGLSLGSVPMSTILENGERRVDSLAEMTDGEGAEEPEGVSEHPSPELGARIGRVKPGKGEADLNALDVETEPEASLERRPAGGGAGALQAPGGAASAGVLHGSAATALEQQARVQEAVREKARGVQSGSSARNLLVESVKTKGQRGTRVFHAERPEVSARAAALALGHWRAAARAEAGAGNEGVRLQVTSGARKAAKQGAAEHGTRRKLESQLLCGEGRPIQVPEDNQVKAATAAAAAALAAPVAAAAPAGRAAPAAPIATAAEVFQPMDYSAIMLQQMWEPRTPAYSFATGTQSGEPTAAGSVQLMSCLQEGALGSWTGAASGMMPQGGVHPVRQAQAQAEARFMSLFQPLSLHGVPRGLDRSGSMNVSMVQSAGAAAAAAGTAPDATLPAGLTPHLALANPALMPMAAGGADRRVAPPMLVPHQAVQLHESLGMSRPSSTLDHSHQMTGAAAAEPGLHKRKWGAGPNGPLLETPVLAVPPFAPYAASVGRDGMEVLRMGGLHRRIGALDSQAQAASGGSLGNHFVDSVGRSKREILEGQAVHLNELLGSELQSKATSK